MGEELPISFSISSQSLSNGGGATNFTLCQDNDFRLYHRCSSFGGLIYHALGDRGDQGTFHMTTLINHENDWDMTLMLSREPGVDESKLQSTLEFLCPRSAHLMRIDL